MPPDASQQPVIDVVGVETSSVDVKKPSVQPMTLSDITAKVHALLKEDYGMEDTEISRLEQFGQFQLADATWTVGGAVPGNDALLIFAMFRGDDNERIADHMQGDVRVYIVPRTIIQPGAREYRRVTLSQIMAKSIVDRMTFDSFVEAVAFEELTNAYQSGILAEDDEEPTAPADKPS
jgi:hypothetical protein